LLYSDLPVDNTGPDDLPKEVGLSKGELEDWIKNRGMVEKV